MKTRRRTAEGFSLVELMVALTAGAIVIGSIYYLGGASARHFHEQQRISQTQMSLRMAMEALRRDVARAGFLGTPNSAVDQRCMTPAREVVAVAFQNDADTATIPNATENGVSADRLTLTGNFVTSDSYLANGLNAGGSTIYLQRTWQSFQRSFVNSETAAFDDAIFTDVFSVGRMLHIQTLQGNNFFVTVSTVNPTAASVTFTPPIGVGGPCVVGLADGSTVAPISRVEYRVMRLQDETAGSTLASLDPGASATGALGTQLVRRELDFDGNPIAGTERVVLEYVADFNLEFIVDNAAAPGLPPALQRLNGAAAVAFVAATPQRVRSIIVSLSARTAQHDPRFPWAARVAGQPLTRFRAANVPGAARVRTMTTEILLPNVAYAGLR